MGDRIYGVSRAEMTVLRAEGKRLMEERDTGEVMLAKVEKHFSNVKRTTARKAARSLSMRLADARQCIARLVDAGKVERDGTIWEENVGNGQRFAAAYKWLGKK